MVQSRAGTRIREARQRRKLSQTALAKAAGISPSYLNLIEHNRRAVAGRVLVALSDALDTSPTELSEAMDRTIMADLHEAVAMLPMDAPDAASADEFASRFPDWARLIGHGIGRIRDQERALAALSDRLTHDPFLSEAVHGILSTITAVRSSASILNQMDDIDDAQKRRFYRSIHEESVRMSTVAEDLATYLSRSATRTREAATPEEALDQMLARHNYRFDALDSAAEGYAGLPLDAATGRLSDLVEEIVASEKDLSSAQARALAAETLNRYADDALSMPLKAFAEAARNCAFDPVHLARTYSQDMHAIFRRLASLHRPWIDAPPMGLATFSASGYPLQRQPLKEFSLPRHGNACARWPVFRAFSQPGLPMVSDMVLADDRRFTALAIALPQEGGRLDAPRDMVASMLFVAAEHSPFAVVPSDTVAVGPSCRICPQDTCTARTEPKILA